VRRAAEIPLAIQWHDGMLLSPQHFQEEGRRHERLLAYHLGHAAPYHQGVVNLEVDLGRLVAGIFRVIHVEAVMPDGTLVFHGEGDPELSVDLRPQAQIMKDTPAPVFLAIPREQLGGAPSGADLARHRSVEGAPVVDEHTGELPLQIPRIVPSARLLVAEEPPARLVCLPLARIRLDGEAFIRTDYVPPTVGIALSSPIGEIGQRIVSRLREKALRLSEKASMLSRTTDRELIAELRRQIHCLVSALPTFEALLYSERPHPFALWTALAGLVGQIAGLSRTPVPPLLPPYRHDDIRAVFEVARDHIFRMVDEGIIESFTAYPLDLRDGRFGVFFQREFKGRTLVLASRASRGIREDQLLAWIEASLVGAAGKLRGMQEARVLGVPRRRIDRHGDLVATPGTLLFEIDEASPYLEPGEPLVVQNTADPTNAAGPSEIILYVKSS
jgi:type VI secretion system protein ImpJ